MKPIFSRNDDIDKIAFLNWRIERDNGVLNMINMADGFILSSIRLARLCLINNSDKSADILIFPILTNANHGIELYLKAIMWLFNILLKSEQRIEGSHNIKQILETVKAKARLVGGEEGHKNFVEATSELQNYIAELFVKINATPKNDKMDFSRYPLDKKYEGHFYVDMIGNVEIDLENFALRFENIRQSLESIADYLYYTELDESESSYE